MSDTEIAQLRQQLRDMEQRLAIQEDVQAVRTLQFKYGYYMDKLLFDEIVELFADDAVIYFMNGVFRGRAGARRLYGGATGLKGPQHGMMFEHIVAQDIVDVAPDRSTARGRFRCFLQGGVHESKRDAPPNVPGQFWEAGIYENEYVRDNGVWKIRLFNYRIVYQATYEGGWAHAGSKPLMVAEYKDTFPALPRGPDELRPLPPTWPQAFIMPFHYPNPVTGQGFDATVSGTGPQPFRG